MTTIAQVRSEPAGVAPVYLAPGVRVLENSFGGHSFTGRVGGLSVGSDGTIFVSDTASGTIWRVTRSGAPERLASWHGSPAGIAAGPDGTVSVADRTGHRVWEVGPRGERRAVAGSGYGLRNGPAGQALFRFPSDLAIAPDGTCYVADTGNHCIRTVSPDGMVATLAGSTYGYGDGRGACVRFREPSALDVDTDGTCFVADSGNNAVRRVTPDGEVTTIAGSPPGGDLDGTGSRAGIRGPSGIAVGGHGRIFVADHDNRALRRIEESGATSTVLRFEGPRWPTAVAVEPDGRVIVASGTFDADHQPCFCLVCVEVGP